jgi:hypothetical protein
MALTKEDKQWLTKAIKRAVKEELTVEMQWEQVKDEETGQPLAHPKLRIEKVFLPSYFVQHLKFHEGAYRGMQETVDKVTNVTGKVGSDVQLIGETLTTMSQPLLAAARFIEYIRAIGMIDHIEQELTKQIEFSEDSRLGKLQRIIDDGASSEAERNKAMAEWHKITGEDYESST